MSIKLTSRQNEIVRFISSYFSQTNKSPALSDIAEHFSISQAGAWYHVRALEKKGILSVASGTSRGISLTSWNTYAPGIIIIPLYRERDYLEGRVKRHEDFNASALMLEKGKSYFCIKMDSSSLINIHIRPGDYLVFRKASTAEYGQLVIAGLEDAENLDMRTYLPQKGKVVLQAECDSIGNISCKTCSIHAILHAVVRLYGKV